MTTDLAEVREVPAENPLALLQNVLADPATDPDKMDKLFALYERMDAKRAERQFAEAMAACKSELPAVVKDKVNPGTKSRYASLEKVCEVIDPVIARHGFTIGVRQGESKQAGWIKLIATVRHSGGHSEETELDLPIDRAGAMNAVQGVCSSVSYGRRYLKTMVFDIAIAESDRDGQVVEGCITEEQAATLANLFDKHDADFGLFCQHFGIEELRDLPAAKYAQAVTGLKRKPLREKQA